MQLNHRCECYDNFQLGQKLPRLKMCLSYPLRK